MKSLSTFLKQIKFSPNFFAFCQFTRIFTISFLRDVGCRCYIYYGNQSFKLSEEEANETLKYVISKYEEVEMKIIGEPVSIYGLRVTYGDDEEELNIHFKYIDNTQYDIIQNCVFVLQHRQNECELIKTICNTFLPITPRPLLQRKDLRICNDGRDVQLVEKEDVDDDDKETSAATTTMTITDVEQVRSANNSEGNDDGDDDDEEEEVGGDVKEKQ